MKTKLYSLLALFIILFIGCSEDKIGPLEQDSVPPGQVTIVEDGIKALPGKVSIRYVLPKDQNLLYVKAAYRLQSGVMREVKASYYANSMVLDGFGDTEEHEVKIYSYNRSEVASEPLVIMVRPLENPIWGIRRTMELLPDFMGIKVKAQNSSRADVAIDVMMQDSVGKWQSLDGIYTSMEEIDQTLRGLDTIPRLFGVAIRDRFLNYTDTLYQKISPLFEELIPKGGYKGLPLGNDSKQDPNSVGLHAMWDNNTDAAQRMMTEQESSGRDAWVTIDLGVAAKLSRIKIWTYAEFMGNSKSLYYYRGCMRYFEVWGCTETPAQDGSWDQWFQLGDFINAKPSGLPYGQNSAEDDAAAQAGFNYDFRIDVPKTRYLRFRNKENWMGTKWMDITEIQLYGDRK